MRSVPGAWSGVALTAAALQAGAVFLLPEEEAGSSRRVIVRGGTASGQGWQDPVRSSDLALSPLS